MPKVHQMKKKILICLILLPFLVVAQKEKPKGDAEDWVIIKNDSLTIPLDEVVIFDKREFKNNKEKRYYYWYYKKVHNAYPYAKLAAETLTEINNELDSLSSKRKKRKHVKKMQKYMEGEFSNKLKKMTRTEGRILIKLLHRQTGQTLFELIKEYRSGWKAFWYNSTAQVFKLSLKKEYHPEEEALDFIVEDILQRSFLNGTLEKQDPKYPIDYLSLLKQYEDIDVQQVISDYIEANMK